MLQNIKKINLDQILSLLIVVSFVYTSFYNLLFFELINSPDYEYYFSYIETFFKINEQSNLEQGLIYHFLIALVLVLSESSINGPNVEIYVSNAIHLVNNLLFLIGLLGTNKLLKFYSVKSTDRKLFILLSIFLPFIMQARFHYKPEIFAIAFIPWLFFNILKYLKEKKFENLIISIIIFVGSAFLKGNIFTMLSILIFLVVVKDLKKIPLIHTFKALFYLIIISVPLLYENQRFNGTNLFSNTQKRIDSEVYQNTVTVDFFTNFSFYKFIRKPNFDPENVNFFSTIFVDTFNDFFGVSWNIDHFPMIKEYSLFENWILNGLFNYAEYYLAFILSIFFYTTLIIFMIKSKNEIERVFYAAPFIGIFVLLINSLGIPFNNFDPEKGDTFKTIYFSFLLFITFIYLFKNITLNKRKTFKFLGILFLIIFSIFSMGINTEIFKNQKFVEQKSFVLQHTPACNIGDFIDFGLFSVNCNPPSDECSEPKLKDNYTKKEIKEDGKIIFYEDGAFKQIYLINDDNFDTKLVKGFDECYHYQELGYSHPFKLKNLRIPFLNLFLFLLMMASIFRSLFFNNLNLRKTN